MSKHTPGPWFAREHYAEQQIQHHITGPVYIEADDGSIIAEGVGVSDGDARLIAAAPDLLDALREAYRVAVGLLTDSQLDFRQPDGWTARQRIERWAAAIAMAEGEDR